MGVLYHRRSNTELCISLIKHSARDFTVLLVPAEAVAVQPHTLTEHGMDANITAELNRQAHIFTELRKTAPLNAFWFD